MIETDGLKSAVNEGNYFLSKISSTRDKEKGGLIIDQEPKLKEGLGDLEKKLVTYKDELEEIQKKLKKERIKFKLVFNTKDLEDYEKVE